MGVFSVCSFPRTGTRRGPNSGSSNLISFTLERSIGKRDHQQGHFIIVTDSNPCLSPIIHVLNTLVVIAKKYFHQIIKQDPVSESKAKSNKSSSSASFCPDQRLSEILYSTCPGITNQGEGLSAILSIILHGLSNHFLYTSINHFPEYQEV